MEYRVGAILWATTAFFECVNCLALGSARLEPPSAVSSTGHTIEFSQPYWAFDEQNIPLEVELQPSNNTVAITRFERRLFMAFRTAPDHFASSETRMIVVSSKDEGRTWDWEWQVDQSTDLREPNFLTVGDKLNLYFVKNGSNPLAFDVEGMYRIQRHARYQWSNPVRIGEPGELFWEMKSRRGKLWSSSYRGNHYDLLGPGEIELRFQFSEDGDHWSGLKPSNPQDRTVYRGGVSEAGFEWTHRFQKGHEPPIYRYQGDSGHRSRKGQLSCARSAA